MLVLLIGFVYTDNKSGYKELIGNYADLYHLNNYFRNFTDDVIVMTDLSSPDKSGLLVDAIKQGILPGSLMTFDRALSWEKKIEVYHDKKDLDRLLSRKGDKVFLYFSGHCSRGKIILPDTPEGMDTLEFRRKLEAENVGSQIFILFDCCDADGTRLPFVWQDKGYVLSSRPAYFTSRNTVCLCSTRKGEDSASKITGSVFTQCFLKHIGGGSMHAMHAMHIPDDTPDEEDKDLSTLLEEINQECGCYPQTATLYSSLPNLKKIWPWLYKR